MRSRVARFLSDSRMCFPGLVLLLVVIGAPAFFTPPTNVRRRSSPQESYRFQENGWTYVHLEGSPSDIGFQHGYLLAAEIADAFQPFNWRTRTPPSGIGNSFAMLPVKCYGRTLMLSTNRSCRELLTVSKPKVSRWTFMTSLL